MKLKEMIVEKTKKITADQLSSANRAVVEVKGLLEWNHTSDMINLRKMAPACKEVIAENEKGKIIQLSSYEKEFKGDVVLSEIIRKVAIKYRLRLLPSNKFKGSIHPKVMTQLRKFETDTGIELNEHRLTTNMYILAPEELFNLEKEEVPKKTITKPPFFSKIEDYLLDPVLLYKIDDDHYHVITSWGKDLTLWRYIKSFITRSATSVFITSLVACVLISSAVISLSVSDINPIFFAILSVSISGLLMEVLRNRTSDKVWNKSTITHTDRQ